MTRPATKGAWSPLGSVGLAVSLTCGLVSAAPASAAEQPERGEPRTVAATVGQQPIYVDQVERELKLVAGKRALDPAARPALLSAALEQLIDRELILGWLRRTGQGASESDVDLQRDRLQRRLQAAGRTLADYCRERQLDERDVRRSLAWALSWSRFLERHLTDENLQRYFAQHRRDFDGTRLRVAHILFPLDAAGSEDSLRRARERALQVRGEIVARKLTFAEAAGQYSQAPSAQEGGDLGFIGRHEPMPEPFARAAFALPLQGISEPVVTPFGVHLITALEERAGERTWTQVRAELEQAVARYLFRWAADRQRGQSPVRRTGAMAEVPPAWLDITPQDSLPENPVR